MFQTRKRYYLDIRYIIRVRCTEFLYQTNNFELNNRATIEWVSNSRSSNKTRHVNLNFHFIRDEIENGNLKINYVESKNMIADFLTKAVTKVKLSWTLQVNMLKIEKSSVNLAASLVGGYVLNADERSNQGWYVCCMCHMCVGSW